MAAELQPRPRAIPWGAVLAGAGALGAGAVALLRIDRLPFSVCFFKTLTGIPCPTCGSTRVFGRLAHLDVAGAFEVNPLTTLLAFGIALWGLIDLALLPRGRAFEFRLSSGAWRLVLWGGALALLLNWAYLIGAGR